MAHNDDDFCAGSKKKSIFFLDKRVCKFHFAFYNKVSHILILMCVTIFYYRAIEHFCSKKKTKKKIKYSALHVVEELMIVWAKVELE